LSKHYILITGGSGFLGQYLASYIKNSRNIVCLYNNSSFRQRFVINEKINLVEFYRLEKLFDKYSFSEIIHCAAITNPDICLKNPELSYKINVVVTEKLSKLSYKYSIPFVFVSTDSVFDGNHPPYSEISEAHPINLYGKQKLEAEKRVLNANPDSIVCRVPRMFGFGLKNTFFHNILNNLSSGRKIKLFSDMFRTPISGLVAARGIEWAMNEKLYGIIHLGGKEQLSWFDFGKIVADIYDFDDSLLIKTSMFNFNYFDKRPVNVSLSSDKAISLGYNCPTLVDQIKELVKNEIENVYN